MSLGYFFKSVVLSPGANELMLGGSPSSGCPEYWACVSWEGRQQILK